MEEKKMVKKFMGEVYSGKGLGIYGLNDVVNNLKSGITDLIIATDSIDLVYLQAICRKCDFSYEKIVEREQLVETKQNIISNPCPNCW